MIDLHCHSNFSDGVLSPSELLQKAIASNIKVLALTDHDTIAGLIELHQAAQDQPIQIINGIEFSVCWKKYDIHIIGLNINPANKLIQSLIERQSQSRIARAIEIGERMQACGVSNAYQKACELAGHERVGRPHFAQVFVNEGLATDLQTAFKRFLGRGKPAYVRTYWLTLSEAIEGIAQAEGQAVLAHPLKYSLTRTRLHELVMAFKDAGGSALEVVSGEMNITQVRELAGLCQRFELLSSTGSDYHGGTLSRIPLGRQQQLPVNCIPIWHQWNINRGLL
ncbi:PHP domain-containing protein [Legionella hackeliae]|uniref:Polymerase and histidinol phosphatase-like n=1 Tax=Legionella hackeliae TaxID=449 RepID=A0A0A8UUW5_LEGHA|nr:PHP domain-containing protein [Legionella hackeliae]KTD09786.1 TrpH protein [Legionella hackeliae]CEK10887.1 Polymerase and histidinol phosphatase-like [Legionella hackeliae]STX47624.1 TrpH protein [Legionella hackeliae]